MTIKKHVQPLTSGTASEKLRKRSSNRFSKSIKILMPASVLETVVGSRLTWERLRQRDGTFGSCRELCELVLSTVRWETRRKCSHLVEGKKSELLKFIEEERNF